MADADLALVEAPMSDAEFERTEQALAVDTRPRAAWMFERQWVEIDGTLPRGHDARLHDVSIFFAFFDIFGECVDGVDMVPRRILAG